MTHDPYVLAAIAALVALALYRRFRRLFGRQPLRAGRLKSRIVALALASAAMLVQSVHAPALALAAAAGLAAGAALAYAGIRLTRFDAMPAGIFYTPNGYIGAALSAVLLARLVYRFYVLYPVFAAAQHGGSVSVDFGRSPLTIALVGIVIGYYLAYFVGLLWRSSAMSAELPAQADAASPPSGP